MKTLFTLLLISAFSMLYAQGDILNISKTGNGKQQVILISGLANKNEIWDQTTDAFTKNKSTVYAIDYFNDNDHKLITIHQISNQIKDWIKREKLKNVILIGHSLGGVIALEVASIIPNTFKFLIIVDSYPSLSALSNPNFTVNQDNNCSPWVSKFTTMTDEEFKTFQSANLAQMTNSSEGQKKLLNWAMNYDRNNYALLLCDYLNTDLRTKIESISCPALVLSSVGVKPFEKNIADQYKSLKQCTIIQSEKGKHFLMLDDFDWYIKSIMNFIN